MRSARLWMLLGVMFAGNFSAFAQNNPNEEQGLKPYDSFHGGDLDSVSLTSGGLSLHIPLASFPQRGNLDLSFMVSFSNKQWYVTPARYGTNGTVLAPAQWLPMPNTGAQIVSSTDWWLNTCSQVEMDPNNPQTLYDWSDSVSSPDGNSHVFGALTGASAPPIFPMRSADNSGLLRPDAHTLILPNGTRYVYPSGSSCAVMKTGQIVKGGIQASSITDANGNQITTSASGWTDTMGRFIPGSPSTVPQGIQPGVNTTDLSKCPSGTASARMWNVPGISTLNGGTRTFYFCYATFSLYTAFPATTGANNYGPVNTSLLSAIVLPDLTMWTFAYDNYGDVLRATFPTGGSLAYTYATGPFNSTSDTSYSTWVTSRTVDANDGTGPHQWTYNFQGNFPGPGNGATTYLYSQKGIATVTDPENNDVVHTIGPGAVGGCPGYEYQTQYFQGPASGGVILKTVQTQYDCTPGEIATNAVPIQVTTTLPRGETARVVNSYDPPAADAQGQYARIGSLLQRDEYDFSNVLARSALNRYIWQDDPIYKSANFVALPKWSTVYNGAAPPSTTLPVCSSTSAPACISQSKYAYDEGTLSQSTIGGPTHVGPPAGEPIRGNLTTSSRWLDTAGAFVSSTSTYFDTGMKATSKDPLLNQTSYTYSPTFLGAYLTQTNLPDTQMPDSGAPVVHHVISGNYDFNTGLLLTFTDENGQPYSYTYDVMLRLTQGNHPDGGITKFFYPDPNTVERQRLITGTTYDDFKVKFDGIGRPYQTLQLTPDCASWIKVDTGYDSVGRAKTVSNPYCLTSEPTYGVTQTLYDALSRTLNTTKQDGSLTSVKYDDTPGDTSGPTLVCTTATDESGKKRQACSDAFGRLVKVIEPNPGAAATNGNGSVTISGSDQTTNVTVSIAVANSGFETPALGAGNFQYSPSGGGWTFGGGTGISANGSGFTSGNPGAPEGSQVAFIQMGSNDVFSQTLSGFQAGVSYTVSFSAAQRANFSNGGQDFDVYLDSTLLGTFRPASTSYGAMSTAAFTTTAGSHTLRFVGRDSAGGDNTAFIDAVQITGTIVIADAGTVTVSINGTPYSTSFGAGDTYSTIASRLATAISAGAYASATASGATIYLTSKTTGTIGDYSLTASYTWNSGQFTNSSFTTSTSGSSMSGAKDAAGINNNPFVTIYQYNARGDMLCVHQKATDTTADVPCTGASAPSVPATWRQRFFTYDSLSRLLTAMNPELNSTGSTVITYGYDNNSRLTSKIEPAPNAAWGSNSTVTFTYTYDALNRLLDTAYSDGTTLKASHRYDYATFQGQSFTNPIGREVATITVNSSGGAVASTFASYDPMGRVLSTAQCNPGVSGCKTFTASYDQLGDLTSLAYPSNSLTVTYGYDSAARLTTATDSNGVIYAQTPAYIAGNIVNEFTSPNFANNKYHVSYNNRLQPIEIWTGSAQGAPALFDKQYSYGTPGANNGNIYTITNVKDATRTQSFSYDPLNRLITAGDNGHWANSYTYDAWGNLTNKTPGAPAGENMNQPADSNNHLSGLTYDAAGNVINDGLGGAFVFDGENRIKTAGSVTYTYDADGRRIQKSSGTNYWYGPGSQVFAETDSSGNWTNYIFFGGQRLARNVNGDIKYYVTDHLHSTAMFVDKAGTTAAILDDNDMYPWGGVVPGVGKTTSNNTVKFTGKYRDTDTAANLDYFGARYYSNTVGRFMSPDWAAAPTNVPYAKFGDPQSLNLYSYTENGPINRIDGDGHMIVGFTGNGVFGVKGTGVDDGSGGFSDGDNPYADADRALWATSLGAIVVVQSPGTGSSSTDAAASQSQPAQPQSAPTQSTAQAQATQAQPTTQQQPASAQPNGQARHGSWEYSQSTGQMTHVLPDGTRVNVGQGYSGNGQGLNTPQAQNQPNTGPIPQGTWHIGHQQDNITGAGHKLPASMRLDPAPGTTTRGGFLIHGDNARRDHSASNGCIILDKNIRNQIGRSGDNMLRVVP